MPRRTDPEPIPAACSAEPASHGGEAVTLQRRLTLPLLTFYGLGSIVGAGIYALIGEIAGYAGLQSPAAFLLAAVVAAFSGLSYAELSARLPRSAGEAAYVEHAFDRRWLTGLTGWAVVATGIVSAATIANAFSGYLGVFVHWPAQLTVTLFVLICGAVAAWGIAESAWMAALMTWLAIAGLLAIMYLAGDAWTQLPEVWPQMLPRDGDAWVGVCLGAFLAFYAFIGFEDMVNVAEEVVEPRRNLPLAILLALLVATLLYVAVALLAVLALPLEQLVDSQAPLADILAQGGRASPRLIALLSLLALASSALAQMIMASRVAFGLAGQGLAPAVFARINRRSRTPLMATITITLLVLVMALWLPMRTLAELTSVVILLIFALVNIALLVIKVRGETDIDTFRVPLFVPVCGAALCIGFVAFRILWSAA